MSPEAVLVHGSKDKGIHPLVVTPTTALAAGSALDG